MNDKTPARWQRKKDARPAEILDAALTLFVEKGFRATKMEDIAQAAGVTKGTPYLYFHNKEDIFKAVVRDTIVARFNDLRSSMQQQHGSAAQLLQWALDGWWEKIGSGRAAGLCKLMMAEAANFPELAQFYYEEVILPGRTFTAQILEQGIARGEFRPVHIDHTVDTLVAPLLTTMIWGHSFGCVPACQTATTAQPQAFLHHALELVLRGLQATPQGTPA
ncbi:MAG TPA: TetR/AcrR family transcriptional regulator [Chromobacteriaceae bacterium]|nr:TetR/AcrR family transcriptional regulator [Chromobacteriaceae bacterium]